MSLRATVAILVLSTGCGATNGSVPSPSPGAQPARKLEGPLITGAVGSFKPTFFGNWPLEDGKSWPGHHIRDLLHGGDPTDAENILPAPQGTHDLFNKAYPACYAGVPPWNTVGPHLPYLDY
jgi:hypothetical protein